MSCGFNTRQSQAGISSRAHSHPLDVSYCWIELGDHRKRAYQQRCGGLTIDSPAEEHVGFASTSLTFTPP